MSDHPSLLDDPAFRAWLDLADDPARSRATKYRWMEARHNARTAGSMAERDIAAKNAAQIEAGENLIGTLARACDQYRAMRAGRAHLLEEMP